MAAPHQFKHPAAKRRQSDAPFPAQFPGPAKSAFKAMNVVMAGFMKTVLVLVLVLARGVGSGHKNHLKL